MIKVLYIISTLKKTGPVNVLYNIIKNLDRTKYEPVILTLSKEPSGSIKSDFEKLGIKCHCLNVSGLKGYFEAGKIIKVVKEITPDIIHTHCFRSTLFTALHLNKYKTVATIHCDYDVDFVMAYGKFIGTLMSFIMNFSLKRINKRITVSELLCNLLKKKKNYDLSFVNNGIDTEKFKPVKNKQELRNKLNLPVDKKIFVWAGVFIERKDPLLLVNTIKKLDNPNLFFVFCGDGKLLPVIKEETEDFKNVIFTGNVDNISEYLQASDFYISTSLSEGLPMAVIEAMACGLPCLLSDIEQHKYVLKEQTGMLFKSQNSSDLIHKINSILDIDYELYSSCARQTVLDNFSSELMSEKYVRLYDLISKYI